MAEPVCLKVLVPELLLAATSGIKAGDVVYYDGTRLVKSDADAVVSYGQFVVTSGYAAVTDDKVAVSRNALFEDTDLSYTVGGLIYLSTTAGGITQTRPTGAGDLRQVVGQAISATLYEIALRLPFEVEIRGEVMETTSGEAALGSRTALDSGRFEGIVLNATTEYVTYGFRVPENAISLVKAPLISSEETATTETYAIEVNSAVDDAAWDAVTADTSETGKDIFTASAADDIGEYDAAAAINATDIFQPGANLAVKVIHGAVGTDPSILLGMTLVVRCV